MHWQTANNKLKYFIAHKNQLLVTLHLLPAVIPGMDLDLLEDYENAPHGASSSYPDEGTVSCICVFVPAGSTWCLTRTLV
jgi:hypothetical protein